MKRTLLVMLALVMTLATVISTVSLVSANDTAATDIKYLDATLNEVAVDGDISFAPGKALGYAEDRVTITSPSSAPTTEFILDTVLGSSSIGAAWSQTAANVYFGIQSYTMIEYVKIEIGGKTADLDASMTSSVTGVEGATSAKKDDDTVIEIAIPLDGLELNKNSRYLYTDLTVTVTVNGEDEVFDGALQFTDYSANFAMNIYQKVINPSAGDITVESDNTLHFVDESIAPKRLSAIVWANGAIQNSKNFAVEFDLNIKEMPYAQVFGGGPGMWETETDEARMWICIKYRLRDQLYFNFINSVDDGIVLLIQEQSGTPNSHDAYKVPAEPQVVKMGKEAGEKFTFKFEWSENNHGIVSVDGKVVYETDKTMSDSPHVGYTTGMLLINTQHTAEFEPGAKIDVEVSNISINQLVDSYDIDKLAELAGSDVDTGTNKEEDKTDNEPTGGTTEGDGNDNADTTDTPSDEEKKGGCGGSLAGLSVAMIAGTALVTAIGSS